MDFLLLRQAVIHTRQKLDISERRACAVLDVARSTLRLSQTSRLYRTTLGDDPAGQAIWVVWL